MYKTAFDSVQWYMNDISCNIVAKSGIPTDRFHLGKLILHCLREDPDFIMQIDGATHQSESNWLAMNRSVRCAIAFTEMGLKKGDVMVLMAPNHLDVAVTHNAALYLGIIVAPIDPTLGVCELEGLFNSTKPKIIFCQSQKTPDIEKAVNCANIETKIVTFDEGSGHPTLARRLEDKNDDLVKNFQPTDFDPDDTVAYLISTSGTTGIPKVAILSHKNLAVSLPYFWNRFSEFPTPTKLAMLLTTLQWLSAAFHYIMAPILKYTRLQSSATITPDHFAELVNKYKPTHLMGNPNMLSILTTASDMCDFTCFDHVVMGGSAVSQELIDRLKTLTKTNDVYGMYGMSEISGLATNHDIPPPPHSSGRPLGGLAYRLVDVENKQDITEANVPGELWLKGPAVFKGYYNNPEATSEILTEDGWLKTGDKFYRDQSWNLFFVERLKLLLKYKNYQISPEEVEAVIKRHPAVLDVVVIGTPHKEHGDLVVACVIPRPVCNLTAQDIKDLVKESLADSKQLRGGVIFMTEFPTTSTSKVNRRQLKEMALTAYRE